MIRDLFDDLPADTAAPPAQSPAPAKPVAKSKPCGKSAARPKTARTAAQASNRTTGRETRQQAGPAAAPLQQLLDSTPALWRGSTPLAAREPTLGSGHAQLDQLLPAGGWPRSGLVDILSSQTGIGELQLLMPLLRTLSQQQKPMLWITPPHQLYAPALLQAGVDTRHIILIQPEDSCQQALWSTEKALQSNQCALVLVWQNWFSARVMRRLQLAARDGNTLGMLFHQRPISHSPANLQLQLQPGHDVLAAAHQRTLDVRLLKAQGSHRRGQVRLRLDS